jgi:NAD(P)-dependent dehydrogenase (short-subunit alcohol dehydrogenase family)
MASRGRAMAERLGGKVAIVTGAASRGEGVGNGAATSILFAREGAKVVLVNRDAGRGEALAGQIRAEGGIGVRGGRHPAGRGGGDGYVRDGTLRAG